MNLTDMRIMVRRDLHDEDSSNYRWTDDEIDRHIAHALRDFSEALPLEQKATIATTAGSREISITSLTSRVHIEAVEYPVGCFPARYQRYALWNETLTLLGEKAPDGSNCNVYYGKLHTLDTGSSTLPAQYEDLVASGGAGYAATQQEAYSINRVNIGGNGTPDNWKSWGQRKLDFFHTELKRLGRNNTVKSRQLYTPDYPIKSQTTDWGP
jgi:hypothetical protein